MRAPPSHKEGTSLQASKRAIKQRQTRPLSNPPRLTHLLLLLYGTVLLCGDGGGCGCGGSGIGELRISMGPWSAAISSPLQAAAATSPSSSSSSSPAAAAAAAAARNMSMSSTPRTGSGLFGDQQHQQQEDNVALALADGRRSVQQDRLALLCARFPSVDEEVVRAALADHRSNGHAGKAAALLRQQFGTAADRFPAAQ